MPEDVERTTWVKDLRDWEFQELIRMKIEIGAYEAKTRLPELLRQVKAGKRFTITNRGEAMADLVPSESVKPKDKSAAVEKFKAFMRKNPVRGAVNIKELIEEGRA